MNNFSQLEVLSELEDNIEKLRTRIKNIKTGLRTR